MQYDIMQILLDRNIEFKRTNNPMEIKIKCTSGMHEDKDPSLHYDLSKHLFQCWSCGFKGGSNRFLKSIGIDTNIQLTTKIEFRIERLLDKVNKMRTNYSINMPYSSTPYLAGFKSISAATMQKFRAFTTSEQGLEDYICFPIYQHGKLRFIDSRYMFDVIDKPKYLRKPFGAMTSDILFPFDKMPKTNKVILCEGIFDALYLHQLGYQNALCIFGTQSFTTKKAELLNNIGIIYADIILDGDIPGRTATTKIRDLLESKDIKCRELYIPDNTDIDELNPEQVKMYLGVPK